MKPRFFLVVVAGLILGADKPGFEITASSDRVTVKGKAFELEGSRVTYEQAKALLVCEGTESRPWAILTWRQGNDKPKRITSTKLESRRASGRRDVVQPGQRNPNMQG
jgi:hypothetical protein